MSLSFIHFSDTHLGFSDLDKQNPDGTNIREQDFYDSFTTIVDKIIEERPAFAVHTGDLFHRPSPSNRTIVFALNEIKRISAAGIPFYVIAGNHDFPKSIFTTPIHNIFGGHNGIKIFFNEEYQTIETDDYIIHALPHINEESRFITECSKIKIVDTSKPNLLFMHLSVGRSYLMDEFGERIFPSELLPVLKDFEYVGLGHWHKYQQLQSFRNVYYSGSTERLSEKEAEDEKGYLSVSLNDKPVVSFHKLSIRPFRKISIKECSGKQKEDILRELNEFNNSDSFSGSIVSVQLSDLDPAQLYTVTSKEISEIFSSALHINICRSVKDSGEILVSSASTFDLKEQLSSEMRKSFISDQEFTKVRELTMNLLSDLEEEEASAN